MMRTHKGLKVGYWGTKRLRIGLGLQGFGGFRASGV